MKFTVSQRELVKLLGHCKSFDTPSRVLGPSQVMLSVQKELLSLSLATVSPSMLALTVSLKEDREDGRLSVPLDKLAEVIGVLDEGNVTVSGQRSQSHLEIVGGKQAVRLRLPVEGTGLEVDWSRFGELPDRLTLEVDALIRGVGEVAFAASRDDTRPILQGLQVQVKEGALTLTGCDGFCMASTTVKAEGPELVKVVQPGYLAWVAKFCKSVKAEKVEFLVGEKGIEAIVKGEAVECWAATSPLTGQYPDISKYMTEHRETTAVVHLDQLRRALRTVKAVSKIDEGVKGRIKLSFNGGLKVSADDRAGTGVDADVDAEVTGAEQSLSLNSDYLAKAIAAFGDYTARLSVSTSFAPLAMKILERDSLFVQMPLSGLTGK